MQWKYVSSEGNLCWWWSLQVHLHRQGRGVENPLDIKTAVLEWSLQNAALLAHCQSYNTTVEEIRKQVMAMRQTGALSTDLAVFASSIYYQLPVVVFEQELEPIWAYTPVVNGTCLTDNPLWVWLRQEHFWPAETNGPNLFHHALKVTAGPSPTFPGVSFVGGGSRTPSSGSRVLSRLLAALCWGWTVA
eukprot:1577170-Amphidinium_carterae.1